MLSGNQPRLFCVVSQSIFLSLKQWVLSGHWPCRELWCVLWAQMELTSRFLPLLQREDVQQETRCGIANHLWISRESFFSSSLCWVFAKAPETPHPHSHPIGSHFRGGRAWDGNCWDGNNPVRALVSSGMNGAFTVVKSCFINVISLRWLISSSICNANQT